ncbi:hypothetical protein HPB51_000302 [Rhipicephalus microplus]|uniref:Uncharacterized protein n=1 Tax=Rhipicephalus microplus TaxID=6941 RepID=A0A9J6EKT7_RHIMP|nr:hypothetical protein HPB51_000302 [Rhipicephalus microplus]
MAWCTGGQPLLWQPLVQSGQCKPPTRLAMQSPGRCLSFSCVRRSHARDAPQPSETPLASRSDSDFQNLQTALRALIRSDTSLTPGAALQPFKHLWFAKSLLSADSSSNRSSSLFAPPASMVTKGGIARRVNQVAKRPTLYMSFPSRSRRGDVELKYFPSLKNSTELVTSQRAAVEL